MKFEKLENSVFTGFPENQYKVKSAFQGVSECFKEFWLGISLGIF